MDMCRRSWYWSWSWQLNQPHKLISTTAQPRPRRVPRIRLAKPLPSWARVLMLIRRRGTQCKIPARRGMALLEIPMCAGGRVVGPFTC